MKISLPNSDIRIVRGKLIDPRGDDSCAYHSNGAILSRKRDGKWSIVESGDFQSLSDKYAWDNAKEIRETGLILPPFFDLHFHWVQDAVRLMPKASLLEWLDEYTFPHEAKFADPDFADVQAQLFWKRILSVGTVGGLCYGSIHQAALEAAMRHAPEHFRIGNVLMTMNCPDSLKQMDDEAIRLDQWGANTYGDRHVASPRFAYTTGPEVVRASAETAEAKDGYRQTHACESLDEIERVIFAYRDFPGFGDLESYIDAYRRTSFLSAKTVLGHCIHLTDAEWRMLKDSESIIASCPTSNAPRYDLGLGSGLFDFHRADEEGVRWVLASDIGGGPYLSMLDVMGSFVRQNQDRDIAEASYGKALCRSTRVAAEVLGLGERKGSFGEGKDLDYIVVDATEGQLAQSHAEDVLQAVISAGKHNREDYDQRVLKTVIEGQTVFEKRS